VSDVDRRGPVDLRLIRLVPALRTHLGVISAVAVVTAFAVVVQAEALANGLTDLVTDGEIAAGIGALVFVLTSVAVVRGLATAVTEWSAARAMRAVRHDVRVAVLDHATLDGDRSAGGLASREATIVTAGVDRLEPYVRQFLPALTLALTVPLIAGARILFADLLSAVLIALTVPLIPVFMVLIGRMTQRRTQRQWAVLQRLGGHFLDVLEGMPTLRLFGRARAQPDSVHDVSEQYRVTTMGALRIAFLSALALELIATLSVALIAVEIGLRLAGGSLDLGTALVVLLLTPECYLPLRRVGASFHAAQSGLDASDDLHDLLSRPSLPVGHAPVPVEGAMAIREVELRRGGRRVLAGLDLDVVPGTLTAVYGPSGIGKSTLIDACRHRVLERSGSITVGGVDVRDLEPAAWADQVTTIVQRLTPVAASVIDEVRAATGASDTSVLRALADVGLTAVARGRADELSGGQLRRVQVARALVAVRCGHARFVLADEPTAHLDAANADAVWSALAGLARQHGAAVLVTTHDARCRSIADHVTDLAPSVASPGPVAPARTATAPAPAPSVPRSAVSITLSPPSFTPGVEPPGHGRAAIAEASLGQRAALRRVLALARPVRRRFVGAAALGTAAEVCTIGLAGAAAWLIVRAAEQPELAALSMAILGVRAFGTGKGVFRYAERLATHDAGLRSLTEIRAAVVSRLAEIAPAGIPGWQRGDMLQRVVGDIDRLLDLFVRVLGPMVAVAATALGALAITAVLDPSAGLVLLTALTVVGVAVPALTVRREVSLGPALGETRAALSGRALAITEGLDQLWANRMLAPARGELDRVADDIDDLERRRAHLRMSTGAIVTAAPLLTATATLATIAAAGGSASGPVIGVLVLWPLAILELVGTLNESAASVPSIAGAAHRVVVVLDTPDPATTPVDPTPVDPRPVVALDHVTARWPTADIDALAAVSMRVEPGAHAHVTGPSGSGKSTLAAVLVGFLAPSSGTYHLGRTDIGEVLGEDVRRRVTWIQQLPWIADSTVRENLRIADQAAGDDELREALRAVRLDEWFDRLEAGLDTQLGRGGSRMSGGEAQRLSLARVLLAGHDVVVLDEPTANLDADTAAEVLATVLDQCAPRTTILLGHGPGSPDGGSARVSQRERQATG
jgi:ATP-binding cassette, subfamily C, bacterial CydCD